jgi:hypothetical protein
MSVCVYSVCVVSCVQVAALRRADPSSKESYRLCKRDQKIEKAAKIQQRDIDGCSWSFSHWPLDVQFSSVQFSSV